MARFAVALVHHPVLDREGGVVTTAITNIDVHDLARSSRTYGAEAFFITHPISAQRLLADRIRSHWVEGTGRRRIPDRADALELVRVVPDVATALETWVGGRDGAEVWTTAASPRGDITTFADARLRLGKSDRPRLILFGTGWGLAPELVESADVRLEPIAGTGGFNHLSVRAACAIALDRLFAR